MSRFAYTVIEYDATGRWVVRSISRDAIELPAGGNFYDWARERWPSPRYSVRLDSPALKPQSL